MSLFLGLDSSTQGLKATAVRREDLQVFKRYAVNFDKDLPHYKTSGGMSASSNSARVTSPTLMWIEALDLILKKMQDDAFPFSEVLAVSGSGQQHGSVYWAKGSGELLGSLDGAQPLTKQLASAFARSESPIWADSSTGAQCARVEKALGRSRLAQATGSRAYERFTGMQIAKILEEEPSVYAGCERISLVSSAMCSVLLGAYAPLDTSDGSGTNLNQLQELGGRGWFVPALEAVAGDAAGLRRRLGPGLCSGHEGLGCVAPYFCKRYGFSESCLVVAWSGDNPNSLAGLGLHEPGDVAVSLGTSDTMFALMAVASPGEDGMVLRNPVDPTSFMGMLVFKNGSLSREVVLKEHCAGQWEQWEKMLANTKPGNSGAMGFYFHNPEITPTTGDKSGIFRFGSDDKELDSFPGPTEVRAVVESKVLAMKAFAQGIGLAPSEVKRIIATGGASASQGILQVLADVFGVPVFTLDQTDSASLGAAFRACHGFRCATEGFVPFSTVLAGKLQYKLAAEPSAEDAYRDALPRYLRLQKEVLAQLAGGDPKRVRS
ncbi:unnamed protein product [Effrenium voratum]|uniref:Xylulose kinase n=1 Tax=Effrenium voratum TaxID=2562239 RepID=A0AA36I167_9DINO|nr:unnamed protein product [Effrenium voratum]CAJ1378249.1 unnamed protein product [Effrenium voratum]CAJ1424229.1 unnamed protein product [Effrenium voratum]